MKFSSSSFCRFKQSFCEWLVILVKVIRFWQCPTQSVQIDPGYFFLYFSSAINDGQKRVRFEVHVLRLKSMSVFKIARLNGLKGLRWADINVNGPVQDQLNFWTIRHRKLSTLCPDLCKESFD